MLASNIEPTQAETVLVGWARCLSVILCALLQAQPLYAGARFVFSHAFSGGFAFAPSPSTRRRGLCNTQRKLQHTPCSSFILSLSMKVLVGVKRVVDYAVKVRVTKGTVDLANVKQSMNPFCEVRCQSQLSFPLPVVLLTPRSCV